MRPGDPFVVTLEVTRAAPTPMGWLLGPDGSRTAFEGWLQLLGAIDRALSWRSEE